MARNPVKCPVMKRTFAILGLVFSLSAAHADDVFYYFGTFSIKTGEGYAYLTENDTTHRLSLRLVFYDGTPIQERLGLMRNFDRQFRFVTSDGRVTALHWTRDPVFRWNGTTILADGSVARIHVSKVLGPIWETLGFPATN
jgi:hypothetical protein